MRTDNPSRSRPLLRSATMAALLLALMLGLLPGVASAPADAAPASFPGENNDARQLKVRANGECVVLEGGRSNVLRTGECGTATPFVASVYIDGEDRLHIANSNLCIRSTWKQSRRVRVTTCSDNDPRQQVRTWNTQQGGYKIQFLRTKRVLDLDEATGKLIQWPNKGPKVRNDANQRFDLVGPAGGRQDVPAIRVPR